MTKHAIAARFELQGPGASLQWGLLQGDKIAIHSHSAAAHAQDEPEIIRGVLAVWS